MSTKPYTESRFHPRQTAETRAGRAPFQASCPTCHELLGYLRKEDAGNRAYGAQVSNMPIPTNARRPCAFVGELSGKTRAGRARFQGSSLAGLAHRAPQCADVEHWTAMHANQRTAETFIQKRNSKCATEYFQRSRFIH